MDLLQFPSLLVSLVSFPLFIILIKRLLVSNPTKLSRGVRALNLPPGPSKLPIIGSLHHLLTSELPHRAFGRLARQYGPMMLVKLGQVDVVVVSSKEGAREVMKSQDLNFCSRPFLPIPNAFTYESTDIAFAPYGEYWRQLKKICTVELLSAKRVSSFHYLINEEISSLIVNIHTLASTDPRKPINLSRMLVSRMNNIISRCAVGSGYSAEDQQKLLLAVKNMLAMLSGFSLVDLFPNVKYLDILTGTRSKVKRIHGHLDEILSNIIVQHELKHPKLGRNDEAEDLVDVLLRIKENGELDIPLTNDNIKSVILDMFVGGSETSSTVVGWAMAEMIKNPHVMEKAKAEIQHVLKGKAKVEIKDLGELHYLNMVIKETLRLHTPVPMLPPREVINTCQVDGYDILAGTRVFVNAWALGRDPRYWGDDAEIFKPEKFSNGSQVDYKGASFEFVPFGAGRRICPGITFGGTNVGFTLANLLFHFNWEVPQGLMPEDLDMTENIWGHSCKKNRSLLTCYSNYPNIFLLVNKIVQLLVGKSKHNSSTKVLCGVPICFICCPCVFSDCCLYHNIYVCGVRSL